MFDFSVIGAGSAGCHNTHALREMGYTVAVIDTDQKAIDRFEKLYKERYMAWDEEIELFNTALPPDSQFIVIATPPDTHLNIIDNLAYSGTKAILVEKPFCVAGDNIDILGDKKIYVNYNHLFSPAMLKLMDYARGRKEEIKSISVEWLESCEFILAAHPWVNKATDYYLFDTKRGGGASHEHSHGLAAAAALIIAAEEKILHIPQHHVEYREDMDIDFSVTIQTEKFPVHVHQDFITKAVSKRVTVHFETLTAEAKFDGKNEDIFTVRKACGTLLSREKFEKTRPKEFEIGLQGFFLQALEKDNEQISVGSERPKVNTKKIAKKVMKILSNTIMDNNEFYD